MIAQADEFVFAPVHTSVAGKDMRIGRELRSNEFPKESIVIKQN